MKAPARGTRAAPTAPVVAACVGPDNVIGVLGLSWREALALSRELGVPVVQVGARQLISARALLEALERRVAPMQAEQSDEARVLAAIGRGGRTAP